MLDYFRSRQGYLPLSEPKRASSPSRARIEWMYCSAMRAAIYALLFTSLICIGYISGRKGSLHHLESWHETSLQAPMSSDASIGSLVVQPKPAGLKVVGLVFFGRREFVDILDCYLRRNLAINGGYLDTIQFLVHTDDEDDLEYLDDLIRSQPGYEKMATPGMNSWAHYEGMWNHTKDPDTIYVKIDDDIMYIHDEAIPRLVNTLLSRPDAVAMGGNTINHAMLAPFHMFTEAVYPFVPENRDNPFSHPKDWRVGGLPPFTGNLTYLASLPLEEYGPYKNQRFLPLPDNLDTLKKTPYSKVNFGEWWVPWAHWQIAGQAHYSLFRNIEQNRLQRYQFGVWNTHYQRFSINFIAIRGSTLAERPITEEDDEQEITVTIPQELNRPFLVESRAIVSHFGYHGQGASLLQTDILNRYRQLANEMACSVHNQKQDLNVTRIITPHK